MINYLFIPFNNYGPSQFAFSQRQVYLFLLNIKTAQIYYDGRNKWNKKIRQRK